MKKNQTSLHSYTSLFVIIILSGLGATAILFTLIIENFNRSVWNVSESVKLISNDLDSMLKTQNLLKKKSDIGDGIIKIGFLADINELKEIFDVFKSDVEEIKDLLKDTELNLGQVVDRIDAETTSFYALQNDIILVRAHLKHLKEIKLPGELDALNALEKGLQEDNEYRQGFNRIAYKGTLTDLNLAEAESVLINEIKKIDNVNATRSLVDVLLWKADSLGDRDLPLQSYRNRSAIFVKEFNKAGVRGNNLFLVKIYLDRILTHLSKKSDYQFIKHNYEEGRQKEEFLIEKIFQLNTQLLASFTKKILPAWGELNDSLSSKERMSRSLVDMVGKRNLDYRSYVIETARRFEGSIALAMACCLLSIFFVSYSFRRSLKVALNDLITTSNMYRDGKFDFKSERSRFHELEDLRAAMSEMSVQIAGLIAQREASLSQIAQIVAHDIRKPISQIEFFLSLLSSSSEKWDDVSKRSMQVSHIKHSCQVAKNLIDDLLEAGRDITLEFAPCSLSSIIERLLVVYESQISEKKITIVKDIQYVANIMIDAPKMERALGNIIVNAVEAIKSDSQILSVRTLQGRLGRVEIHIENTGSSIAPNLIGRIFDVFVTSKPTGTGLGLYIVRKIINLHNGSIKAVSKENLVRFVIELEVSGEIA